MPRVALQCRGKPRDRTLVVTEYEKYATSGIAGEVTLDSFSAFMDEVSAFTGQAFSTVDICIPEVFISGLLGSMLVYLFSSFAIAAVA